MSNLQRLAAALSAAFFLMGCGAITATRFPSRANPMRWTYPRPLVDVVQCLESNSLVVDAWGDVVKTELLYAPLKDKSATRHVVPLTSEGYGSDAVHSETYLHGSCPLGIYGHWQARVTALSASTTDVEVIPLNLAVHNYDCVYIGHPWGCAAPVRSSTVEEYRLLRALRGCLGTPAMPPVERPNGEIPNPTRCD